MAATAHKFGHNIDTDQIIPARYLTTSDRRLLAPHCLEDATPLRDGPSFVDRVAPGDVIVGLDNFGCGSSREHAPLAILGSSVAAVIASSFARIFFRNAINLGLPLFECRDAAESIADGDVIELDATSGVIRNQSKQESYRAQPLPEFAREIMAAGGLMAYTATRMKQRRKQQEETHHV